MSSIKLCILVITLTLSGLCAANPAKASVWKGTPMDGVVEEMRSSCAEGTDALSCIKFKVMNFLDTIFKKDNYQISDDIEVRHNGFAGNDVTGRSENGFLDTVEDYLQTHDVTFNLPAANSKVTISPRNINDNELNLKFKFSDEGRSSVEARKSKLKKVVIPIMVFILLKAMTLIPLALGVLGLKAWNSLQLSFFSFVISVALAIFQLCKKLASDHHHPQIAAHGPWDSGRTFYTAEPMPTNVNGQDLAYNSYA